MAIQIDNISLGSISIDGSPKTYNVTPAADYVDEGNSLTINVTADGEFDGTALYWTINNITTSDADFSAVSGSFTVTNFAGSFTISAIQDNSAESEETFTVSIRTGSISGTVVKTSSTLSLRNITLASQVAYTTAGTYTWIVPYGISNVSILVVGPGGNGGSAYGGGGGGGGLAYLNNLSVTPGTSYTVQVGSAGTQTYFNTSAYLYANSGNTGTNGNSNTAGGGGGAAGYIARGGNGGAATSGTFYSGGAGGTAGGTAATAGYQGGNGGQGSNANVSTTQATGGQGGGGGGGAGGWGSPYGGGGVGILGQGTSGTGGAATAANGNGQSINNGGSGGTNGTSGGGGTYGGGGAGILGGGGVGAVRIIWPGNTRYFPSTQTTDM